MIPSLSSFLAASPRTTSVMNASFSFSFLSLSFFTNCKQVFIIISSGMQPMFRSLSIAFCNLLMYPSKLFLALFFNMRTFVLSCTYHCFMHILEMHSRLWSDFSTSQIIQFIPNRPLISFRQLRFDVFQLLLTSLLLIVQISEESTTEVSHFHRGLKKL